jgi:hypothetical protein
MEREPMNQSPNGSGATSPIQDAENVKTMTLKLTLDELRLLATLASDQLFRRQFIDPKMPGFKPNAVEMNLGKALVARLRLMLDEEAPKKTPPMRMTG